MVHHDSWRAFALGTVLLLCASGDAVAESAHGRVLEVHLEKDRLSVEVGAVPLVDVLNTIAEQTGAELFVRCDLGTVRPQVFTDQPLAEAIRRLVEPNNLVMTFAQATAPDAGLRLVSLSVCGPTARSLGETDAEPVKRP